VLTTEAEEYHLAPGQLARFAEVGDIAIREAGMLLQVDVRLLG
jgi:hypothetical protein